MKKRSQKLKQAEHRRRRKSARRKKRKQEKWLNHLKYKERHAGGFGIQAVGAYKRTKARMTAPSTFSIRDNASETVGFLHEIHERLSANQEVFVNMRDVTKITNDAAACLRIVRTTTICPVDLPGGIT